MYLLWGLSLKVKPQGQDWVLLAAVKARYLSLLLCVLSYFLVVVIKYYVICLIIIIIISSSSSSGSISNMNMYISIVFRQGEVHYGIIGLPIMIAKLVNWLLLFSIDY